jgi:hypothetical protein
MRFYALRDHLCENRFIDRQSLEIRRDLDEWMGWLDHSFDWADNSRVLAFDVSEDLDSLALFVKAC